MELRIGAYIIPVNGIFFAFASLAFLWVAYHALYPGLLRSRREAMIVLPVICTLGLAGACAYGLLADTTSITANGPISIKTAFVPGSFGGMWGVIAGGLLCGWVFRKVGPLRMADALVPALIVGAMVARVGEIFERSSPGIEFSVFGALPFLYWPVYDISALGIVLILTHLTPTSGRVPGLCLTRFILAYAVLRFVIEFARDAEVAASMLTYGQLMCIAQVLAGICLMMFCREREVTVRGAQNVVFPKSSTEHTHGA